MENYYRSFIINIMQKKIALKHLGLLILFLMSFTTVIQFPKEELLGKGTPELFGKNHQLRKEAHDAYIKMSTAALILQYTYKQNPSFSTLPLKCEADFYKKAVGITNFICNDGKMIKKKLKEAIETKKPVIIKAFTQGIDKNSKVICEFNFTWSVKTRDY